MFISYFVKFVSNKDWVLEKINPLRIKKISETNMFISYNEDS